MFMYIFLFYWYFISSEYVLSKSSNSDCLNSFSSSACKQLTNIDFSRTSSLIFNNASFTKLSNYSDNFGHLLKLAPAAVLKPGKAKDIVKLIQFVYRYNSKLKNRKTKIFVACRGNGHATNDQNLLNKTGIIIDMSGLSSILHINTNKLWIDVEAGILWLQILKATLKLNPPLSPRSWTDVLTLSVGGTLSNVGISGQASRFGPQISNVLELDVITGTGRFITCSPTSNSALFYAVLGGLGQFGIIVRARIPLRIAPLKTRTYTAVYSDIQSFTSDQIMFLNDPKKLFDYVEGSINVSSNPFTFTIELAKYYDNPSTLPTNSYLASISHFNTDSLTDVDSTYFDFLNRVQATVDYLISIGVWDFPHPWLDLWLPASNITKFYNSAVASSNPVLINGPVLLYPIPTDLINSKTSLAFPSDPSNVIFLFDMLRTASPDPTLIAAAEADNLRVKTAAIGLGGKGLFNIAYTKGEWIQQYGSKYARLSKYKKRYDPLGILTPNQHIFD
ncbi:unnamed protein product [Didymodactylos carnosus]|uniref:cytokinin dehydrogenase n=1 Tax=Didymodactylos carnosus TaxID=1234261 RepID=A0A815IYD0_9BILA|nr:unnamed protein product [Didymodactylos carnosus]CAF1372918.1 unnamed protein product [Didymodactylos carnosus]CAF4038428.1 unnamed protein product [Didymodactylos carnosus]CAF4260931.1 unnamed protein product [Didymodactylos carnosus]